MIAAPLLGLARPAAGADVHASARRRGLAFVASAIGIFGIIATAGVSMFPFLMPSDIAPAASLTVWDASSSRLTLFVMLVATLIFLPIVLIYTAIAFRALRGRGDREHGREEFRNLYEPVSIERRAMWYFTWILGVGFACRLRHSQRAVARAVSAGRQDRRRMMVTDAI